MGRGAGGLGLPLAPSSGELCTACLSACSTVTTEHLPASSPQGPLGFLAQLSAEGRDLDCMGLLFTRYREATSLCLLVLAVSTHIEWPATGTPSPVQTRYEALGAGSCVSSRGCCCRCTCAVTRQLVVCTKRL